MLLVPRITKINGCNTTCNGFVIASFILLQLLSSVSSLSNPPSRRDFVRAVPSLVALPSLFCSLPVEAADVGGTYVVTGSTSGIGLEACKILAQQDKNTIVMAGRTAASAQAAVSLLQESSSTKAKLIPAECDLSSLKSIESFATSLGTETIDTLCLNAGISRNTNAKDCARTADGYELTVGINHFGHFYLNHLLLPRVSKRIVVTASGVHDPESPGGAQGYTASLGNLQGLESGTREDFEMIDGGPFNADKAYKDSKLCNVFFARELQRRLCLDDKTKNIVVNSFSPGLIVGTGLFRDQNPVFTKLFDVAATGLFKVGETPEWGGAALAYMTTVTTQGEYYLSPPGSSKYGNEAFGKQFIASPVSKEAQDAAKGQRLWDLTASSLGIRTV